MTPTPTELAQAMVEKLMKMLARELTEYRKGSRGISAHERGRAYDQLGYFIRGLKDGRILAEIENSSTTERTKIDNIRNYLQMVESDRGNDQGVREVARIALMLIEDSSKPNEKGREE